MMRSRVPNLVVFALSVLSLSGCPEFIWTDDQPSLWSTSTDNCAPKSVQSCGSIRSCPYQGYGAYGAPACATNGVVTSADDGRSCLATCEVHAGHIAKNLYKNLNDCIVRQCQGNIEGGIPWVLPNAVGGPTAIWNYWNPCVQRVTNYGGACGSESLACDTDPSFRSVCSPSQDAGVNKLPDASYPPQPDLATKPCTSWQHRLLYCEDPMSVYWPQNKFDACHASVTSLFLGLPPSEKADADAVLACGKAHGCIDYTPPIPGVFLGVNCLEANCKPEMKQCDPSY